MSININDLTHAQLNTLAALGQGWHLVMTADDREFLGCGSWNDEKGFVIIEKDYDPCNNWSQAGELVEKYNMFAGYQPNLKRWCAGTWFGNNDQIAHLPKLAITRAFVASRYGTDIDYDAIIGGE